MVRMPYYSIIVWKLYCHSNSKCVFPCVMRLSILCPTTPPTGLGGDRWGFVILASTKAPPLGATLADKSPLIPCIGGGVWKRMVLYETLLHRNSRSFAYKLYHRSLIMSFSIKQSQLLSKKAHRLYKLLAIPANISSLLKTSANLIFQKQLSCRDLRRSQETVFAPTALPIFSQASCETTPPHTTPYSSVY